MANKKTKAARLVAATKTTQDTQQRSVSNQPAGFFPFARVTSIVGVHTTFLAFTALFLPQTSTWLDPYLPELLQPLSTTSLDRPQHPLAERLTANPLKTLIYMGAGVAVLQGWWGGWVRKWHVDYYLEGGNDEKRIEQNRARKWPSLLRAWIATFGGSFVVHAIMVLFGAPIASHVLQTYSLALLLSMLALFTPFYVYGIPSLASSSNALIDRLTYIRLFAELSIRTPVERAIVYPTVGTFLGCWVGVLPIALDWDRPWQAWPLTPAFGAMGGFIVGSLAALTASGLELLVEEGKKAEQESKEAAEGPAVKVVPVN